MKVSLGYAFPLGEAIYAVGRYDADCTPQEMSL
jgi:hypothetical protein